MRISDIDEWFLQLPKKLFGGKSGNRRKFLVWMLTAVIFGIVILLSLISAGVDIGVF